MFNCLFNFLNKLYTKWSIRFYKGHVHRIDWDEFSHNNYTI